MSNAKIEDQSFEKFASLNKIHDAVALVMGQNPVGIERTKDFLKKFNELDISCQTLFIDWANTPKVKIPINENRCNVEEIARHEMAHIVVAKSLGFRTGEATLVIYSADRSHLGTSEIFLDSPITSLNEITTYLKRRAMVLLSGYLSEDNNSIDRSRCAANIYEYYKSESDIQKAVELIQILFNLEGVTNFIDRKKRQDAIAQHALTIVDNNFEVIDVLAKRFAERIEFYEQRIGWQTHEIDEQPEILQIKKYTDLN